MRFGDPGTYESFDKGVGTAVTSPSMSFDDGTACTVRYGGSSYKGLCNGKYEAFKLPTYEGSDLYAGLTGQLGLVDSGPIGGIGSFVLNSSGDVAYNNISREELNQAYPVATPEPGTWALMLTGVGVAVVAHRRIVA